MGREGCMGKSRGFLRSEGGEGVGLESLEVMVALERGARSQVEVEGLPVALVQ